MKRTKHEPVISNIYTALITVLLVKTGIVAWSQVFSYLSVCVYLKLLYLCKEF